MPINNMPGIEIGRLVMIGNTQYKWTGIAWEPQAKVKIPKYIPYPDPPKMKKAEPSPPPEETDEMTPEYKACLLVGEGMKNDTSSRSELCPKCGGGADKEKAFSISRDASGYIYWKCFRAKCGYRGSTGGGSKGRRTSSREVRAFTDPTVDLTDEQWDYFTDEYGLDQTPSIKYAPTRDAYVFEARASSGGLIGRHLRWFDGRSPKSDTYPEARNLPQVGFYNNILEYGLVVVEDPLSAIKVCQAGFTTACLFGTHLDWERAYLLRSVCPNIHLALDRGTMPLMIEHRDKYGLLFDGVSIWSLDEDLKYVSKARIQKAASEGHTNFMTVK